MYMYIPVRLIHSVANSCGRPRQRGGQGMKPSVLGPILESRGGLAVNLLVRGLEIEKNLSFYFR